MEKCLCICRSPSNLLLLDSYYTDSKMKENNKKSPLLLSDIEQLQCIGGAKSCASKDNSNDIVNGQESCAKAGYGDNYQKRNCGCSELDDITEHYRKSLVRNGNWIHLLYKSARVFSKEAKQIPQLHHLHQQDCIFTVCDTHVLLYDCPTDGKNYLSVNSWGLSQHAKPSFKKPHFVNDLQKKQLLLDLESVVLALNCSNVAKEFLEQHVGVSKSVITCLFTSILPQLAAILRQFVAVSVASIFSIIYLFLQFLRKDFFGRSRTVFFVAQKVFRHSCRYAHIRSCQILYWPIFLQDTGLSYLSNAEYAQKAALKKHFIWSNLAVDVILGIVLGVTLFTNIEAICFSTVTIAHYVTDNVLRAGCVWLMGVPAGFKLNSELAELLGMISLNAIQIFSTLWFFMSTSLGHIILGLAISGIVFGLTIPAALCIDMINLATVHVRTLHLFISFLYSQQIQVLASLWRLFRGRKWNPLRRRLDSYDYTVEQHVVGSLLFTPILLLLPTTSAFYIFFTMLNSMITSICIMVEIMISFLHATPYAEVIFWLTMRRRFPSGIWFETTQASSKHSSADYGLLEEGSLASESAERNLGLLINEGSESSLSLLRSNYATIGEVVAPHYRNIFSGVDSFFGRSLAYGLLSGQRIPSTLNTSLPSSLPWMHIGVWEYWRLCYSSTSASSL
ncbi:Phosphatidylinositol N-acetylglucosaminyltransferase subunit Q [Ananas comosus]|uniref:Phosphatidylinositol N-acetylglucosaminyltransferase subunit Q n=1 Tax=Ananas comosus TaxID=4615 RepID=A0A199UJ45_ANACO|nr:Phosphatidylinositol N-acetylglucosaminyltransferase subunit Q [Ananas comosus]